MIKENMIYTGHHPRRLIALATAAVLITAACSSGDNRPDVQVKDGGIGRGGELAAEVASYDLVAGRTGRFIVGLLAGDHSRLLAFGTVELTFTYLGERDASAPAGPPTAPVTARFLPIPGQRLDHGGPGPRFVEGSEGTGVYGSNGVSFARPGFWRVAVTAIVDGQRRQAEAAFSVLARSSIPAPGDPAPRTEHPIAGTPGVDPRSVDSRAGHDSAIPDPELHTTTIAAALNAKRPLMVVVSTPTYCQSRFCGPITDSVAALAKRSGDRMAFVHLEVWRDFEKGQLNDAVRQWIFPPGTEDAREPWVFVVGRDGRITQRFDNVATDTELEQAVALATK